jgi:hypothetical protein
MMDKKELTRIIGEGVGAASMCWESMEGTGVFQNARAGQIVNELVEAAVSYARAGEAMTILGNPDIQLQARTYAFQYIRERINKTDEDAFNSFGMDDVYVVWFTKVLQNWRCMISTTLPDGMYYEVTYDGDAKVVHLWAFKNFSNIVAPDFPGESSLQMAKLSPTEMARYHAMMYVKAHRKELERTSTGFKNGDFKVLWISEILQNWKSIVTTWLTDDMFFEVTYDGDKNQTYLDVYKKWDTIRISLGEDSSA